MTTPKQLDQFRVDRGWSPQRLSDEIFVATRVRISYRTLMRFMQRIGRPTRITVNTIKRYMDAQKRQPEASSR